MKLAIQIFFTGQTLQTKLEWFLLCNLISFHVAPAPQPSLITNINCLPVNISSPLTEILPKE
jgi:hypothetical protein